jgi:pimeloyl-ACP methyl ester carboxylesterase
MLVALTPMRKLGNFILFNGTVSQMTGIERKWISGDQGRGRLSFEICSPRQASASPRTRIVKTVLSALIFTVYLCGTNSGAAGQSIVESSARYSALHSFPVKARLVTVEDLRVHYIEAGTGRTVVMIHGNAGNVEDFEFGTIQLLSPNYRIVAIDRPGHGSSDRPNGKVATLEYQAKLLHETLSTLGISKPILVGHSWGAALALAYALNYPDDVSGMVLLAPAAYPDSGESRFLRFATRTPLIGDLSLVLGKPLLGRHILKQALAQAFYPQAVPNSYLTTACALWLGRRQVNAYIEDESALNNSLKRMSERYSKIRVPVVIVTGDKDKIVSANENAYRLHSVVPGSQLIELKDTGHEIPQTHPESIYSALSLISQSKGEL